MKKRVIFDYGKLKGKIAEKESNQQKVAEEIGLSKTSISLKLNNKVYFTPDEMLKICDYLGIPEKDLSNYFFKQNVQKTEQEQEVS